MENLKKIVCKTRSGPGVSYVWGRY